MGLTIHYSARIKDYNCIDELVTEVADICTGFEWEYHLVDDENLKGIFFTPPECESVYYTFNREGRLLSPLAIMVKDIYEENNVDKELMFTAFTKTQYAGPDVHKAIINLMRYISKKYFSAFQLTDESYYWETGDEQKMLAQFSRYNFLANHISDALQDVKTGKGENMQNFADKIEAILKKKLDELKDKDDQ